MMYYGPNAEILGSIKLEIWHYQTVISDIQGYVWNVSFLFFVDIFSLIINTGLIWYFCRINLLKLLKRLQQEFWLVFMITEGYITYILMEVSSK